MGGGCGGAKANLRYFLILNFGHRCQKVLRRINTLIKETKRTLFEGFGKPEPLKHALSGYWSRRITDEHRFVYKVSENAINIAQLRYHY